MHDIAREESLTNSSAETKILTTDGTITAPYVGMSGDKRLIIITPVCDMGGGSAVARVRVKSRSSNE